MDNNEKSKQGVDLEQKRIDSFVDSIEEEIRNENWQKLWNKYGKVITYASCVLLIGVGIYAMWQKQDMADREAISSRYTLVQNQIMSGNLEEAVPQIKKLSSVSKRDYATLSKLEYAAILRDQNNKDALKEYKSLFEDKKVNPVLRDLAYILYVSSSIDLMSTKELLDGKLNSFIEKLQKEHVGKYWDLFAKETLAFCYMKQGDNVSAKKALEALAKTPEISQAMAERAKALISALED